jgi:hypothetical protein
MMIAARESFAAARRGIPTARDYVQDGLVAMWDGIENAGWGVHDPNATTWKNLVGASGGDIVVTAGHFTEDALAVTGYNASQRVGMPSSPTNTLTVDIAFTIPNVIRAEKGMFFWRDTSNGPFKISSAWNYLRITGGGYGTYGNDSNSYDIAPYVGQTFRARMTTFVGQKGLYVGGIMARPDFSTSASLDDRYRVQFRDGGQGELRYHATRVYSRFLTAEEIAANHAIDQARFNLP